MNIEIFKKMPLIVAIIGMIVIVIAFFIAWVSFTGNILYKNLGPATGLDLLLQKDGYSRIASGYVSYLPTIILVIGLIIGILAVIKIAKPDLIKIPEKKINIAYIVAGVAIVILFVAFMMYSYTKKSGLDIGGDVIFTFSDHLSGGAYLALFGALIFILNGILGLAGTYDKMVASLENGGQAAEPAVASEPAATETVTQEPLVKEEPENKDEEKPSV